MTDLENRVRGILDRAPFMKMLGVSLVGVGEGWVETELTVGDDLRRQHGFAQAGVVSTLADHTAGAAATTAVSGGQSVLTADFTIHLLRPGAGEVLRSRGEVVRAGRSLIFALPMCGPTVCTVLATPRPWPWLRGRSNGQSKDFLSLCNLSSQASPTVSSQSATSRSGVTLAV